MLGDSGREPARAGRRRTGPELRALGCAGIGTAALARGAGLPLPVRQAAHARLTCPVRGDARPRLACTQDGSSVREAGAYADPRPGNRVYAAGLGERARARPPKCSCGDRSPLAWAVAPARRALTCPPLLSEMLSSCSTALSDLPRCDSDGARALSHRELARADVVPYAPDATGPASGASVGRPSQACARRPWTRSTLATAEAASRKVTRGAAGWT